MESLNFGKKGMKSMPQGPKESVKNKELSDEEANESEL